MGKLNFTVSNARDIDPRVWQTAYITGMEGVPWHSRHQLGNDQFIIGREIDESGKVNIVWPTQTLGNVCLTTTSLRETAEYYNLAVELARGMVGKLQSQTAEWQRIGLKLPDEFFQLADGGLRTFLRCLTFSRDVRQQESLAQSSIEQAIQASTILCHEFAQQVLHTRRQSEGPLTTFLGASLPPQVDLPQYATELSSAFNLLNIKPDLGYVEHSSGQSSYATFDAQVQWATNRQIQLCIGPLVDFRPERFPKWMVLLGEDYKSMMHAACQHAESTVKRYRGRAQVWNCAAGLNSPNALHWSDDEVFRMAVAILSTVRQTDDRTPVVLTIEQPWSEYLRDHSGGLSPLHFADALIRADLGISGLALELNFDTWPGGSFPRDLIELSRLVDRWALLGLPLLVYVTSPTQRSNGDERRVSSWRMDVDGDTEKVKAEGRRGPARQAGPTGARYTGIIPPELIVQLLLSKSSVHAVIWDQLTETGGVSDIGLWDARDKPKPLLQEFIDLKKRYL